MTRSVGPSRTVPGLFLALARHLDEGILLVDPVARRVVEANAAFCRLSGCEPSEIAGQPLDHLHDAEDLERLLRGGRARVPGNGSAFRVSCRRKDGSRWSASLRGLRIEEGGPWLVAIYQDATPRERQERREQHRREIVSPLFGRAASAEELATGLRALVASLGQATDSDRCGLAFPLPADRHRKQIATDIFWSAPGIRSFEGVQVPFAGNRVLQEILERNEPLVVEDCGADPRLVPILNLVREYDLRSLLVQPLAVSGVVRGLLALHRCKEPRPFSEEHLGLVRDVAAHAAVAIDNLVMAERERRRERQIRLLAEVQHRVTRLSSLPDLLDLITRSVAETLGFRFVNICLLEPEGRHLKVRSVHGGPAALDPATTRIPVADAPGCGLSGAAAATGRAVLCNDVSQDPRYLEGHAETRSELDVPIQGPDGPLGVLSIQSDRLDAFDPGDVDLFVTFAGQVAVAIRNARAFESERSRNSQLQILHRVQSSVARLDDPLELAQIAADAIHQLLPEFSVTVSLMDPRGGERGVRSAEGGAPAAGGAGPGPRLRVPIVSAQGDAGVLTVEAGRPQDFSDEEAATFRTVAGILGVAMDNARLFERVEQEREEWARTFDAITDMVSVHDGDFRLLRANRALLARLDAPAYALAGRTCLELYGAIVGPSPECPHAEAERTHQPAAREIERPGGGVFRLTALPCFRVGRLAYSVHLCEEITEERRLREQLLQSEKMVAVGQLVSGVAHELNNPLASVMGYTQLMLGRPLENKLRTGLERVFHEAQRAAKIVQNLLTFARKHKPEKRYLGLNGIVEKTLELRAYELRVSNVEVETRLEPDLPKTMLDFHQLQQVLLNIITNAEQAMLVAHGRGRLRIATGRNAGRIELRVQDDGPGIPPEHMGRIFDPFFTTKPVGQGTGLGLSICHGIVNDHGGRLWAESLPGEGATFTLELPILEAEPAAEAPGGAAPRAPAAAGGHILVVEDEAAIQDLLVEILSHEGHRVDTASSGTGALAKLEKGEYDLIISDLKMPGMGGAELYERLREKRPDLAARVIFTSGDTVSPETHAFLDRTGSVAILKPFKIDELKLTVARCLQGH